MFTLQVIALTQRTPVSRKRPSSSEYCLYFPRAFDKPSHEGYRPGSTMFIPHREEPSDACKAKLRFTKVVLVIVPEFGG